MTRFTRYFVDERRRVAWLAGAVTLVALATIAVGMRVFGAGPAASATAAPPSKYDHFLFLRHDAVAGQRGGTDTLVMAQITPAGFMTKDLYSRRNLSFDLESLGVFGGQVYWTQTNQLYQLDLATGRCVPVSEEYGSLLASVDGKAFMREAGKIREYDLRSGAYREVATLAPSLSRFAASPDGKRLAFFTQVPSTLYGHASQLNVVDVATGVVSPVGSPIFFMQFALSSQILIGPPFVWLNEKDILLLRTEGKVQRNASGGIAWRHGDLTDHLVTINVDTGQLRSVVAIPSTPGVHRLNLPKPAPGSPPILEIGQTRYAVDVPGGRLAKTDAIGGDFRLQETSEPRGPTLSRLYHGTTVLASEEHRISARVSPDGARVIWGGGWPPKSHYYDARDGALTQLEHVPADHLFWFSSEDLTPTPTRIPPGWKPMQELPEGP